MGIGLLPLTSTGTLTTSATVDMGAVNTFNATTAPLTATLPLLSTAGLNVGAWAVVEKYSLDVSANAVTITRAGSDTFSDGTTTLALTTAGMSRMLMVVMEGGVRKWKVVGGLGGVGGGGGDASTNVTTSTTGQLAAFANTAGKILTPVTVSGIAKFAGGVPSPATPGIDYSTPSSSDVMTNKSMDLNAGNNITNISGAHISPSATIPRVLLFAGGVWPARPADTRPTEFRGGSAATNAPTDVNLQPLDSWIPATA